ncbi:MAG: acetyl-CoA carboxylase biotin carboxyl carrier protein subunit [Burkholderiales bacterium]|nr:acetyl-CoA carboxylase biotin carboxyl carrier protein subunit [Burkholderiales bacterium]
MTDVESIVTGVVWKVEKQPGDRVAEGEVIMIMESMKMEIPIESPVTGAVRSIAVSEGESVTEGQVVAIVA